MNHPSDAPGDNAQKALNAMQKGMGEKEFKRFSEFIHSRLGIKMPPSKKVLLQSRFQKRLRTLGFSDFKQYCDYVFSPEGMEFELQNLVDVVTTNTTHFFREPKHFEVLTNHVLPELTGQRGIRNLKVWSAGCSSGEEPYTLAMVLADFVERSGGIDYSILATDISMDILRRAARAVYALDKVEDIPVQYRKKYLLRSKDRTKGLIKIDRSLRRKIEFRQMNFMEAIRLDKLRDIIFCRNVVIYFDRPTQEKLFNQFCQWLKPGGYLFIGHSESISGMRLPLENVVPTVFRRI